MEILAGYTGFVGGNLVAVHKFDILCNSKNITEAFGTNPDLLVYAAVPSEMFYSNNNPEADRAVTENAVENIRKINPKRLVLISTIAVLENPVNINEDVPVNTQGLTTYGLNRLNLEITVRKAIVNCHIIRLPALFGNGIKKNFIYDMIHYIPVKLDQCKFNELSSREPLISKCYISQGNGFYELRVDNNKRLVLKSAFKRLGFSALNFTDSRSVFQFYSLVYLWRHIEIILKNNLPLLHIATVPLSAGELYEYINGEIFANEFCKKPFFYDFRTKYANLFGGTGEYIFGKEKILFDIKNFIKEQNNKNQ
jgi:hypothetical protein